MKPRIFVGSSAEHLDLAYAVQENLERDAEVTVWSQGVFELSRTAMASLIETLDESDFGVFILAPADLTSIRQAERPTVRDNVIFELGLFIGRLGADRCFMFVPRGSDDLHLPSDLLGLTPGTYEPARRDNNLAAALGPACNRVRTAVSRLGGHLPTGREGGLPISAPELCTDDNDCLSIIESWMGGRPASDNRRVMRYDHIDRELNLTPGAAKKHLEVAASRWDYVVARKGQDTILFMDKPVSRIDYF
jgi:hypothetical protein